MNVKYTLILLLLLSSRVLLSQDTQATFRVMFYNVENYFDIRNDSLKNDDEFTPGGLRKWDYFRFRKKQQNISKVIAGVGE